ncbi:hypothetical protein B0H63DRAFT_208737 [Podospora didyma]|uniref:Uncharacterized protein n=1 Tax=Podospora didyma TaxID=330526 RepID=A0AAE0NHC5_9PEZI|nr:hypothetical protein B0H63DRAFT_208737 [Podospora didyma]
MEAYHVWWIMRMMWMLIICSEARVVVKSLRGRRRAFYYLFGDRIHLGVGEEKKKGWQASGIFSDWVGAASAAAKISSMRRARTIWMGRREGGRGAWCTTGGYIVEFNSPTTTGKVKAGDAQPILGATQTSGWKYSRRRGPMSDVLASNEKTKGPP